MRKGSLIIFCLFLVATVLAQKVIPIRIEVPTDIDVEKFHVEPLDEDGVLIFYESNEVNISEERKWYFGLFNTKMKQQWLKFVPLPDKIDYIETKQFSNKLYILFKNNTSSRGDNGFYEIVSYNIKSGAFSKVSGTIPEKAKIAGFDVLGNTGCLVLNLKDEDSDLLFIDLVDGSIIPVRVQEDVVSQFQTLYADRRTNKFYLVIKNIKDKRYMHDEILRFSKEGKQEKVLPIESVQALKLLRTFVFVPAGNNELVIMGTYDIITGKVSSFRDLEGTEEAKGAGMFFLKFENDEQKMIKFHDFMSFENVYGTLGNRQMDYSKNKNTNDGQSAKTLMAFYHMLTPEVIKVKDQYVFSVEVYKPNYRAETRMDYDYYGRPTPYTYNIFDGYKFYDIILTGVSENGDLIWNNDFVIRDLKSYSLSRNCIVFQDDDFISMAYVNNGKVISQTIEGPIDIGSAEIEIDTKLKKDRITADENNFIIPWYDDFFLIYGYQKLNNRTLGDQSIRTVFYANKIAYQ